MPNSSAQPVACMQLKHIPCPEQLQYAAKRGFYFSTPKPGTGAQEKEVPPLPKDFIQVGSLRSRASVTCTTHKLNALNARLSDAATDCLVLTEQVSLPTTLPGETPAAVTAAFCLTWPQG